MSSEVRPIQLRILTSILAISSLLGLSTMGLAEIGLKAPAEVPVGSVFEVTWDAREPQGLIRVAAADGSKFRGSYAYTPPSAAKGTSVKLTAPLVPGEYGIIFEEKGKEPAGLIKFQATAVTATLSGPDSAKIGENVVITFTGPAYPKDLIQFAGPDGEKIKARSYVYAGNSKDGTVKLRAPMEAGAYSVIYSMSDVTLAKHLINVAGTAANLTAADTVQAGTMLEIFWEGPDNTGDFITLRDADGKQVAGRSYTGNSQAKAIALEVPESPGTYTLVYVSGDKVLGQRAVEIVPTSATLEAPAEVTAGYQFEVRWSGPGNRQDLIVTIKPDDENTLVTYSYLDPSESTEVMFAPDEPGDYLLQYRTREKSILTSRPLKVIPAPTQPGTLTVRANPQTSFGNGSAIEVILDASGSMLQKMDGKRRIEIARETLISLISESIPAGTPFALRVFGHKEAESCRTDLEIPLSPLDPVVHGAQIGNINAINLAKTPIAASLAAVPSDLAEVPGERIVILLTDGEETCDGDPALTIRALRKAGTDLRVNIVGYAIDDENLRQTFESWAALGGGQYLNAPSAEALSDAMKQALAVPYEIYQGDTLVARGVTGDKLHKLPAGELILRYTHGGEEKEKQVTITSEENAEIVIP
ncbi:vWA domain-containing protein [Haloferula sp.]|uniref:vWA domain-containing protein n=1 Tax=Haloferula sp. TaxID=2497595 RepID=UPI003C7441AA